MTAWAAAALVITALGVVALRRRTLAIYLVGLQSIVLGGVALVAGVGHSTELVLAGTALVVKGVALPGLLILVVRSTPEPRLIVEERHAVSRLIVAVAFAGALMLVLPTLGLADRLVQDTAAALVALGISVALLRRAAVFHALGFLVAENGVYTAAIGTAGGLPAVIEVGLIFDLVVVVAVAALFSRRIHTEFGTGDTARLRRIRD